MPVQPVLASINCLGTKIERSDKCCCKKMMSCGARKNRVHKRSSQRSCDEKNCPLGLCTCCYYTSVNRPVFESPCVIIQTNKIRLVNETSLSNFISDCWHPPEFV